MTQPSIVENVDLASLPQRLAAQFLDGLVVAVPVLALVYGSSWSMAPRHCTDSASGPPAC